MDVEVAKPAERAIDGGLARMVGGCHDALGCRRIDVLFLLGLRVLILEGRDGVLPVELSHCLQKLRV